MLCPYCEIVAKLMLHSVMTYVINLWLNLGSEACLITMFENCQKCLVWIFLPKNDKKNYFSNIWIFVPKMVLILVISLISKEFEFSRQNWPKLAFSNTMIFRVFINFQTLNKYSKWTSHCYCWWSWTEISLDFTPCLRPWMMTWCVFTLVWNLPAESLLDAPCKSHDILLPTLIITKLYMIKIWCLPNGFNHFLCSKIIVKSL